jgi:hypothetical protein
MDRAVSSIKNIVTHKILFWVDWGMLSKLGMLGLSTDYP